MAGLNLDPWQAWILQESLAESSRGKWSASEVAVLVSRQNGKGSILEARQLAGLYLIHDRLGVHSAHEFRTCFEHFLRIVTLIESTPELDRRVMRIRRGAGEQAIELKTGERLRFLARSAGSGRGMSGDAIYLDEAFALTSTVMGALLPTLSARPDPQVWYMSSAPKATSDVLHGIRRRGRAGNSPRLFYAEWAADADCDPYDRDIWYATNPALGIRISEAAVEMELAAFGDMPEEFARERLGVPDGEDGAAGVVPIDLWDSLIQPYEMIGADSLALDVSVDSKRASIVAAKVDGGVVHLDIVDRREGTEWLAGRAGELYAKFQVPFRVPMNGPAVAQIPLLRALGVQIVEVGAAEMTRAAAGFVESCTNRRLRHLGNVSMRNAITGAAVKTVGDLTTWGRKTSTADISPLVAASLALAGAESSGPSVYEERGALIL